MTEPLASGTVISDRYRLERLIGEGGMGAVWAATHIITRKHVALKFLKGAKTDESLLRRFLREARAVSAVNHPNVVAVHDVIQLPDGLPVMVMDLLEGMSLAERLAQVRTIPLHELAQILVPVLSAVGTAHAAGIVHRDLKPDNIFLHRRADGQLEPKVLDFGIAKLGAKEGEAAATAHLTQTGALLGTPYYMSPEQVFGEKDLDQRADVWSMGVILYECLSGQRPVEGDNYGQLFKAIATGSITPLEQIAPGVPSDITRLVGRMLSPDRDARPHDLREAYETLCRYSSDKAISFGGAAHAPQVIVSTPAASSDPALAFDATGVAQDPGSSSPGVFSRTSTFGGTHTTLPVRRVWPLAAALVLVVGGVTGSVWWVSRTGEAVGATASAEPPATPSASVSEVSSPTPPKVVPTDPETPKRDAGPPRRDSGSSVSRKAKSRPVRHAAQKPTPPAALPPDTSAQSEKPAKLPGNVVGKVPF